MKLITATIKPHCLDNIRTALIELGVNGMTITEAQDFGSERGHIELYRSTEYEVHFVSKMKLEIAVDDNMVDAVVESIFNNANSGKIDSGSIFVTALDRIIRIRTGEIDSLAV